LTDEVVALKQESIKLGILALEQKMLRITLQRRLTFFKK
jgi:hypothetical protein